MEMTLRRLLPCAGPRFFTPRLRRTRSDTLAGVGGFISQGYWKPARTRYAAGWLSWPRWSTYCLLFYSVLQIAHATEHSGILSSRFLSLRRAGDVLTSSGVTAQSSGRSTSCFDLYKIVNWGAPSPLCLLPIKLADVLRVVGHASVRASHRCFRCRRDYGSIHEGDFLKHSSINFPHWKNPTLSPHTRTAGGVASFLIFSARNHVGASKAGPWAYPSPPFFSPTHSHLYAATSTATATHPQPGVSEGPGNKQTAQKRYLPPSASSVCVSQLARSQFPFASSVEQADAPPAHLYGGLEVATSKSEAEDKRNKSPIYFDNAATTQKPWVVLQALQRAYIQENANVHRSTYSRAAAATERLEGVRDRLANYLNAELPEEIVFTSGATDSINLVAGSWGDAHISEGDEMILSIAEHHSNVVPWQLLAARKHASLKYVELDEQLLLSVPSLVSALSPKTKLVALSHTSNVLGSFNPYVREVIRLIKQFNQSIVVLLDASQAVAHYKLDVRDLLCDFLVGSGHKMYGPTGVGFLYGRHDLLQEMPPWKGGGEMIAEVQRSSSTYADPPARFEAGTPPFVQITGLGAALDFMEQVGLSEIASHESKLHNTLRSALEAYIPSLRLLCPPACPAPPPQLAGMVMPSEASKKLEPLPPAPLVSFVHPFLHAQDIATFLDVCDEICIRAGHHCCQLLHREALRVPASCRASLAVYNTEDEVHRFVRSAQSVINLLEQQRLKASHAAREGEHPGTREVLPQAEKLSV